MRKIMVMAVTIIAAGTVAGVASVAFSSSGTLPSPQSASQKLAQITAHRAAQQSASVLPTVPPTTAAAAPAQATEPTGIQQVRMSPAPNVFVQYDQWQGIINGQFTLVGAGAVADEQGNATSEGAVVVSVPSNGGAHPTIIGTYTDPSVGGPFQITTASNDTLTVTGANGASAHFDVVTKTFSS